MPQCQESIQNCTPTLDLHPHRRTTAQKIPQGNTTTGVQIESKLSQKTGQSKTQGTHYRTYNNSDHTSKCTPANNTTNTRIKRNYTIGQPETSTDNTPEQHHTLPGPQMSTTSQADTLTNGEKQNLQKNISDPRCGRLQHTTSDLPDPMQTLWQTVCKPDGPTVEIQNSQTPDGHQKQTPARCLTRTLQKRRLCRHKQCISAIPGRHCPDRR